LLDKALNYRSKMGRDGYEPFNSDLEKFAKEVLPKADDEDINLFFTPARTT